MRKQPSKATLEARIAKRYHKLHIPLIELIQSVQDLQINGSSITEIEITPNRGELTIQYAVHATKVILCDKEKKLSLLIEPGKTTS